MPKSARAQSRRDDPEGDMAAGVFLLIFCGTLLEIRCGRGIVIPTSTDNPTPETRAVRNNGNRLPLQAEE